MKRKLTREWQIFLISLTIFTRLPVPSTIAYSDKRRNESYKYAGVVGLLVGALCGMVFSIASGIWTHEVSIVLAMIAGVLLTGAFHEDGFADTCDGFGGGFTPQRKLAIMKDSRVGAYALLGTLLIVLLKYSTLIAIEQVVVSLIVAHGLSRVIAVSFTHTHQYVQQAEQSKLNISRNHSNPKERETLWWTALATLILVPGWWAPVGLLITLLILRWWLGGWMVKQVGGYTGDALGAAQQISEVAIYLFLLGVL